MRIDQFDYDLPEELIAQEPETRRDASRLLLVDRYSDDRSETTFDRLDQLLETGDLLVINETRVRAARLLARKSTGGRVEILRINPHAEDPRGLTWNCMVSASGGLRPGMRLQVEEHLEAEVVSLSAPGRLVLRFSSSDGDISGALERHGRMPLPPYIRRAADDRRSTADVERYQTIFARIEGAIAAPTAGLHFTGELNQRLRNRGIDIRPLVLHVGPGTFQPVRVENIEDHRVEAEDFELPSETALAISACRRRGGRVIAVGTTVTRVLEARWAGGRGVRAGAGACDLYIRPGHSFRVVDALITNLHLPRSSLLILVAAFAGRERILSAYRGAIELGFRFYSYGDAMMIR
jgi:S-adenosylmethionine:tRNA ribosyltransferase-isomerase